MSHLSALRKYQLHGGCGYGPGIHLIKLPKLRRQFVFFVPRTLAAPSAPALMFFHGTYQTPWFSINALGLPDMLERYGWLAVLPFGKKMYSNESMGGVRQCCSPGCDEACCLAGKQITEKDALKELQVVRTSHNDLAKIMKIAILQ